MVGGEHDHIIDAGLVEPLEEGAELAVEAHLLQAHLAAFGAIGVADIVVGGEADGNDVGGRALAELLVLDQALREHENGGIEFRRGAEGAAVAALRAKRPVPMVTPGATWIG